MSTRRLIALALVCGIAILVAGGVQLLLLSRDSGDEAPAALLQPGSPAEVGDVSAVLEGAVRTSAGDVELDVALELAAGGGSVDDAEAGWGLLRGDSGALVDRVDDAGTCAGRAIGPGEAVRCTVLFRPAEDAGTSFVGVYVREGRAASWPVTVP